MPAEYPPDKSATPLPTIETIPTEILEKIYFDSGNPWLAFASPELYSKLNSTRNHKRWVENIAFRPVPTLTSEEHTSRKNRDYPPAADEKPDAMDERIEEFGCIASQPWFMRYINDFSPDRLISYYALERWVRTNDVVHLFECQRRWNQNFGNAFHYMVKYHSLHLSTFTNLGTRSGGIAKRNLLRAIDEACCPAISLLLSVPYPALAHYAPDDKVYAANSLVPNERWVKRWSTLDSIRITQPLSLKYVELGLDPICHALESQQQDTHFVHGFILIYLARYAQRRRLSVGANARRDDSKIRTLLGNKVYRFYWPLFKHLLARAKQ